MRRGRPSRAIGGSQGAEPDYAGPKEFAAIIKADIERFAKVTKEANIRQVD